MEQYDVMPSLQLLLTIPQVAKALNLGRTKVYELIEKETYLSNGLGVLYGSHRRI